MIDLAGIFEKLQLLQNENYLLREQSAKDRARIEELSAKPPAALRPITVDADIAPETLIAEGPRMAEEQAKQWLRDNVLPILAPHVRVNPSTRREYAIERAMTLSVTFWVPS